MNYRDRQGDKSMYRMDWSVNQKKTIEIKQPYIE